MSIASRVMSNAAITGPVIAFGLVMGSLCSWQQNATAAEPAPSTVSFPPSGYIGTEKIIGWNADRAIQCNTGILIAAGGQSIATIDLATNDRRALTIAEVCRQSGHAPLLPYAKENNTDSTVTQSSVNGFYTKSEQVSNFNVFQITDCTLGIQYFTGGGSLEVQDLTLNPDRRDELRRECTNIGAVPIF